MIEDVEKWSVGNGITAHGTGTHVACDVGLRSSPLDVELAVALSAAPQNQQVTPIADMAVSSGPEPLLRRSIGSGRDGRQAIGWNPDHLPTMAEVQRPCVTPGAMRSPR